MSDVFDTNEYLALHDSQLCLHIKPSFLFYPRSVHRVSVRVPILHAIIVVEIQAL